jgi:hypothetical protein
MKLTRATIDTIKLPHGKQDIIVFDESLPGFGLRIRAGGSRNWIVQYELRGHQQRRYTIGSVKVFSPEEARKVAREKLAEARLGKDPQGEKREANEQAKPDAWIHHRTLPLCKRAQAAAWEYARDQASSA